MKKKSFLIFGGGAVCGLLSGAFWTLKNAGSLYKEERRQHDLYERLYRTSNLFFEKHLQGKTLEKYLLNNNIRDIGIYGMGDMANKIYDSLNGTKVRVVCEINENKTAYSDMKLLTMNDEFPPMDAVIVTNFADSEDISERLENKGSFKILFIEDIIFNEL